MTGENLRANTFEEKGLKANGWRMETGSCGYCVRLVESSLHVIEIFLRFAIIVS